MEKINVSENAPIHLGRRGENKARQILFDVSAWQELYGSGSVQLIACRYGDTSPYPVSAERSGSTVIWTVTAADTAAAGPGSCELQYYVDDILVKSEIRATFVSDALGLPSDTAPAPQQSWVEQVLAVGAKAQAALTHVPQVGKNGNWLIWDPELGRYKDSGHKVQGELGVFQPVDSTLTQPEVAADAQAVGNALAAIADDSAAIHAALEAKQAQLAAGTDYATPQQLSQRLTNHNAAEDAHPALAQRILAAEALARGRTSGRVFDTKAAMNAWLAEPANKAALTLGDHFYIRAADVPDYWWDGSVALPLETEKVLLDGYATENWVAQRGYLLPAALKNQVIPFAQAAQRENLVSGDSLDTILGKARKWFADLGALAFQSAAAKASLSADVQRSLEKADTALQPADLAGWAKQAEKPVYTPAEVGAAPVWSAAQTYGSNAWCLWRGELWRNTGSAVRGAEPGTDYSKWNVPYSNRNLLDNPWFTVNQRGAVTWNTGYGADRWYANGSGTTLTLHDNTNTATADSYPRSLFVSATAVRTGLAQRLPKEAITPGQTYTFSAMRATGVLMTAVMTAPTVPDAVALVPYENGGDVWNCGMRFMPSLDAWVVFVCTADSTASINLTAVKLESGAVSTLTNDTVPNYAAELLKCQRYFQLYPSAAERPADVYQCRPVMRDKSTASVKNTAPVQGSIVVRRGGSDVTYYYNNCDL